MNLKELKRISDKGRTSTKRRGGKTSMPNSSDDNMEISAMNSTVSYYLEKYPYLECFGDFKDLADIANIWEDSLAKEFNDVTSDGMAYLCYPKFSKGTISQLFSALDSQYKSMVKSNGYIEYAPLSLSFRFGREGALSGKAFVKIPMSCNLESKGFQQEFQSYYNAMPDEEKTKMKEQMEKVSSWVQPVMFAYLSETSKKEKRGLKSDVKKLNKVLTKGSSETVWLVGNVPEDSVFSPFVDNEHYQIAYRTKEELKGITGANDTDLGYVEDVAKNAKDNVATYLGSIGLSNSGDTTGDFLYKYCKCYAYILSQTMEVPVGDSKILDSLDIDKSNDLFTRVSQFITKCGEEKVGNAEVEEYNELYKELKPFGDFSVKDLVKGIKGAVSGIKQTVGNILGNKGKLGE